MSATKIYPSAPYKLKTNVKEKLEQKTNFVNRFDSSFNMFIEIINHVKCEILKSKKDEEFILSQTLFQKKLTILSRLV